VLRSVCKTPARGGSPYLGRKEYLGLQLRLYRVLIDEYDPDDALRCGEEAWAEDCPTGEPGLDIKALKDSVFETADLWTRGIEVAEYEEFLDMLLGSITTGNPPSLRPLPDGVQLADDDDDGVDDDGQAGLSGSGHSGGIPAHGVDGKLEDDLLKNHLNLRKSLSNKSKQKKKGSKGRGHGGMPSMPRQEGAPSAPSFPDGAETGEKPEEPPPATLKRTPSVSIKVNYDRNARFTSRPWQLEPRAPSPVLPSPHSPQHFPTPSASLMLQNRQPLYKSPPDDGRVRTPRSPRSPLMPSRNHFLRPMGAQPPAWTPRHRSHESVDAYEDSFLSPRAGFGAGSSSRGSLWSRGCMPNSFGSPLGYGGASWGSNSPPGSPSGEETVPTPSQCRSPPCDGSSPPRSGSPESTGVTTTLAPPLWEEPEPESELIPLVTIPLASTRVQSPSFETVADREHAHRRPSPLLPDRSPSPPRSPPRSPRPCSPPPRSPPRSRPNRRGCGAIAGEDGSPPRLASCYGTPCTSGGPSSPSVSTCAYARTSLSSRPEGSTWVDTASGAKVSDAIPGPFDVPKALVPTLLDPLRPLLGETCCGASTTATSNSRTASRRSLGPTVQSVTLAELMYEWEMLPVSPRASPRKMLAPKSPRARVPRPTSISAGMESTAFAKLGTKMLRVL